MLRLKRSEYAAVRAELGFGLIARIFAIRHGKVCFRGNRCDLARQLAEAAIRSGYPISDKLRAVAKETR